MSLSINFWVGLDVHKESVTAAVFRNRESEPLRVDRLSSDLHKLRRYFQRLQAEGTVRACYEASGAGYVLQRSLTEWGIECHLAAPSLIPRRPGDRRKTDRRDAIKIARDFRNDRLVLIHAPTELGDLRRFEGPRQLMAYVGLVPGEHSSGDRRRLGSITKAGNARVRHILIQAAWHYQKRPTVGAPLRKRQQGQEP